MRTPLALWAGMVKEGQVGCSCLSLQELSDRAWAARLGTPGRSLDDPARTPSVPLGTFTAGFNGRRTTKVHLELLAVKSVQGSAGSAIILLT